MRKLLYIHITIHASNLNERTSDTARVEAVAPEQWATAEEKQATPAKKRATPEKKLATAQEEQATAAKKRALPQKRLSQSPLTHPHNNKPSVAPPNLARITTKPIQNL